MRLQQLQRLRIATAACNFGGSNAGTCLLPSTTICDAGSGQPNRFSHPSSNIVAGMSGLNNISGFFGQCTDTNSTTTAGATSTDRSRFINPVIASILADQQQKHKEQDEAGLVLLQPKFHLNTPNNSLNSHQIIAPTMSTVMSSAANSLPTFSNLALATNVFSDFNCIHNALSSAPLTQQQLRRPQQQAMVATNPPGTSISSQILANRGPYTRVGAIEPFPEKLHRLLMEVENCGRDDVISFVNGGRGFAIHKPGKCSGRLSCKVSAGALLLTNDCFHVSDTFFNEIVPLYFRHSRLSSFKRQLNLYGFEQINIGPHRGGTFR